MNPLLEQFIAETREQIEQAGTSLLALEKQPGDAELINTVFRSVHTIKGASGLFEFKAITLAVHAAEDLFSAVRDGRVALNPELTDLLFESFDHVSQWIDEVEASETLSGGAIERATRLSQDLRAHLERLVGDPAQPKVEEKPGAAAVASAAPTVDQSWLAGCSPEDRAAIDAAAAAGTVLLLTFEPDAECYFRGEDPLLLVRQTPGLLALSIEPIAPWPPLAELDPYRNNLRFRLATAAPRAELEHLYRYVPEQVRIAELTKPEREHAVAPAPAARTGKPDTVEQTMLKRVLEQQIRILDLPDAASRLDPVAAIVRNCLSFAGLPQALSAFEAALATARASESVAAVRTCLASLLEGERDADTAKPADVTPSAEAKPTVQEELQVRESDKPGSKTIRVEQTKIDKLMDLIGEMVVAKNSLPYLAQRAEREFEVPELAREIKEQYATINRIVQEMQRAIMRVRMLPVSQVFQRFPRLVRDMARKLDKQIELEIVGEETEADKTIIEALADPLLHLVRNSIDHGIEKPDAREQLGKPSVGTIRLAAKQENDRVLIDISDDGAGIDPARVKRKALAKGLISEEAAMSMTDEQAIRLVFAPGFSTAEQVSDLSGRGVGTDVVKTTIEGFGGAVQLFSRKGEGCTTRLTLPMSMAVTQVMTIEVGERLFGVSMDVIHATVRLPREKIFRIKDREAFVLRERVVPLLRMHDVLGLPRSDREIEEEAVLVASIGNEDVGLVVDDFQDKVEIILKPMEGILAGIPGYTGTALLGDGSVLLTLDLKELV